MGYKIQHFTNLITQPLNTHNFMCRIPGFETWAPLVSATTFPVEMLQVVTRYIQGERIQYPAIPQNGGTWNFTLPEGDEAQVFKDYISMMSMLWSQPNAELQDPYWDTVEIVQMDLKNNPVLGIALRGCWIQGAGAVSLSNQAATTPWDWQFTMVYQWAEPMGSVGGLAGILRDVLQNGVKGALKNWGTAAAKKGLDQLLNKIL
jgi:hypothetical protein